MILHTLACSVQRVAEECVPRCSNVECGCSVSHGAEKIEQSDRGVNVIMRQQTEGRQGKYMLEFFLFFRNQVRTRIQRDTCINSNVKTINCSRFLGGAGCFWSRILGEPSSTSMALRGWGVGYSKRAVRRQTFFMVIFTLFLIFLSSPVSFIY